jgi:hypothetical protein
MRRTIRRVNRILEPRSDVPTFTESRHQRGMALPTRRHLAPGREAHPVGIELEEETLT